MNNHKVVLVRPFFQGHFPNYFQLFLNSCACNPHFDWIFFTDNKDKYDYPSNVRKVYMTFDEVKRIFQSKFDFPINISNLGKLCDIKPTYGYLFADYLKEYDFWGHVDLDVIYGKLDNFVTDDLLDSYDKIFTKGHFSLYRNCEEMNKLFMSEINGRLLFKEVMQATDNRNFDEDWNGRPNVNDIYRSHGMRVYENIDNERKVADIRAKSHAFRVVYQNRSDHKDVIEPIKNSLFTHYKGKLIRYEMTEGKFLEDEFLYIHLPKRNMKMIDGVEKCSDFTIIPDAFIPLNEPVTEQNFHAFRKKTNNIYFNYFKRRWNNLKTKIRRARSTKE